MLHVPGHGDIHAPALDASKYGCHLAIVTLGTAPGGPLTRDRLKPATPNVTEAAAYLPRIPWRWILLGAGFGGTIIGGYQMKESHKAEHLRTQILNVHDQELEPARVRYQEFRSNLETLILEAGRANAATRFVDPRLKLSGLRKGRGLYLRLPAEAASSLEKLAAAAKVAEADAITKCMGLTTASARGLFEQGEFLGESFTEDVGAPNSVMQLRVKDEVLARHIRVDLPSVLGLIDRDWFMLILQQGENRRDAPVEAYLWDLRQNRLLLRSEIQSRGALLGARIATGNAPYFAEGPNTRDGAAHDCSIASQIRALTGHPVTSVRNSDQQHAPLNQVDASTPSASSPVGR